ncbi:MAG: NUDIX domain-containing protein [Pseudomonadota bacterium]
MTHLYRFGFRLFGLWRAINHRLIGVLGGRTLGVRMVVLRAGQVCLIRHSYGDRRAWMLPGGAVDWREAPEAAAVRETAEEVGISELTRLRIVDAFRHRLNWGEDIVIVYAADTAQDAVCNSLEIAEVVWAEPNALPPDTTERTRRAIRSATGG